MDSISNSWAIGMFLALSRPDLWSIFANILTTSKLTTTKLSVRTNSFNCSIHCAKSVCIRIYSGPHFYHIFPHFYRMRSISPYSAQTREELMMNCFSGMVDRRKTFSLISNRDNGHRSSPSRIPDTLQAAFEPAQNLS